MTITEWTESEWQQEIEDDMKTQHTPGPWRATPSMACGDGTQLAQWAVWPDDTQYARIGSITDGQHSEANARLIAAAPELFDALELAQTTIKRLHRHAPGSANGTLDVIQKALELATRR